MYKTDYQQNSGNQPYRPVRGYDCGNGNFKTPAYLSKTQMNAINEYAALNDLSFSGAISDLISLGLTVEDKTTTDRRRMASMLNWPDGAENWNIVALDHLLMVEQEFGADNLSQHVRWIREKAKTS